MHYYKLNIPSWTQSTRHLLPEEEGVYLRLVNHYYDTERPLPEDLSPVLRRLQLQPYKDIVSNILTEFFDLTGKGWVHGRCVKEIKDFHEFIKKQKINGAKGGRVKRGISLSGTQRLPTASPTLTQKEPRPKPTTNHKPLTTNQEPRTKKNDVLANANTGETEGSTVGVPFEAIKTLWNIMAEKEGLPQVVKITTTMKGQIRQRHADLERDMNRWDNFFKYIARNDFLAGRAPPGRDRSTPFRCTLLWATRETNFQKIAAKEYDQ